MKNHFWIIAFCLFHLPAVSQNRTGTITGKAVNPEGRPVSGMHIMLLATPHADVTDQDGYYIIENIPPGSYDVQLDHISYKPVTLTGVKVQPDAVTTIPNVQFEWNVLSGEHIVITATRARRTLTQISRPVNVISERRIQEKDSRNTAEILREETGLYVQKTSHGGGSAIIRGMSSNQILILVDGIRMNNSTYRLGSHPYLTLVDVGIVQQMEIVRGPTSALYGSDALGGTINLLTRTSSERGSNPLHFRLMGRYASADGGKISRSDIAWQSGKFAVRAGFGINKFNDLRRGRNSSHSELENSAPGSLQSPTGFEANHFDTKLIVSPSPNQSLIFAYQKSNRSHVPRYDKYENSDYYVWQYHPQNRDLAYLKYENTLNHKSLNKIHASVSFNRQKEGREIQRSVTDRLAREMDDVRTLGFTLQLSSSFGRHSVIYGTDLYQDFVNSAREYTEPETGILSPDIRGRYPDGSRYRSLGAYIQDEYRAASFLNVMAGIRFSTFYAQFSIPRMDSDAFPLVNHSQKFHAVTANLGGRIPLNSWLSLNLNISQGFRAPNLSDIAKLGESKGNIYEVPNPGLKAEKIINLDTGLRISHSRIRGAVFVYASRLQDMLVSSPGLYLGSPSYVMNGVDYKIKTKMNSGAGIIHGLESSLRWSISSMLILSANLTATYGHNTSLGEPIGGIPPLFGFASLRLGESAPYVEFYCRYAASQRRLSADDKDDPRIPADGTPAWQTLNMRSGLTFSVFQLQLAMENILDINYREHGSGVNGPGRNIIISLSLGL